MSKTTTNRFFKAAKFKKIFFYDFHIDINHIIEGLQIVKKITFVLNLYHFPKCL